MNVICLLSGHGSLFPVAASVPSTLAFHGSRADRQVFLPHLRALVRAGPTGTSAGPMGYAERRGAERRIRERGGHH